LSFQVLSSPTVVRIQTAATLLVNFKAMLSQ